MIFPFLVSFFSFYHITFVGDLYIYEFLLALYLLFSLGKLRLLAEPFPSKIILFGGLWLLSQIVTDIIRSTPVDNFMRGWASIIFFLIDFCALYILVRLKPEVLRILILGSALGTIFSVYFLPTDYSEFEPWKFGYGYPVTILTLLYLSTGLRYKAKFAPMLLVALGALGIYLNARSLGGMTILTALILYLGQKPGLHSYVKKRHNPIKWAGFGLVVLICGFGILTLYQWAAESGYLPENVTEKYQMNKSGDSGVIAMIEAGRPEIFISSRAVIDSPIIGHGSWPEDAKYSSMAYEAVFRLGLDIDESIMKYGIESNDAIPTHSVLMQAWVWAGLLGAFFWLFVLRLLASSLVAISFFSNLLQPLAVFMGINCIWDILFSPFGSSQRFFWAFALVLFFVVGSILESTRLGFKGESRGGKGGSELDVAVHGGSLR